LTTADSLSIIDISFFDKGDVMKVHGRPTRIDWLGLVWVTLLFGLGLTGLQVAVRIALVFARDPIGVLLRSDEVGAVATADRLPARVRLPVVNRGFAMRAELDTVV
jgi:hypothetical protein